MATPATIWATNAGAGAANGTSLADAYSLANAVVAVNALGALSQHLTVRICGDCVIAAALAVTKDATTTWRITWQGRDAADSGDAEIDIDANDGAHSVWTLTAADLHEWRHLHPTNTDEAVGNHGWDVTANADYCFWYKCRASHCCDGWVAVTGTLVSKVVECRAHDNAGRGFYLEKGAVHVECVAHDNAGRGFDGGKCDRCLSYGNSDGFKTTHPPVECISYGNSGQGFRTGHTDRILVVDCIAVNNGAYSYYVAAATGAMQLNRCADYGNTSGRNNSGTGSWVDIGDPGLTADPFVDAANGDFRLNKAAGGGALLRGLGFTFPGGLTTSYHDVGGAQHEAAMSSVVQGTIVRG